MIAVLTGLLMAGQVHCYAQSSVEEYKARREAELRQFKARREADLQQFRDRRNAEFAAMLGRAWKSAEPREDAVNILKNTPSLPPKVYDGEKREDRTETGYRTIEAKIQHETHTPLTVVPAPDCPETFVTVSFYRAEYRLHYDRRSCLKPVGSAPGDVKKVWETLSARAWDPLVKDYQEIISNGRFCDWAAFKFAESVAREVCAGSGGNSAVVLQAYLLVSAGYRVCLASDQEGKLHILVGTNYDADGCRSFCHGGDDYLLPEPGFEGKLAFQDASFEGTRPFVLPFEYAGDFCVNADSSCRKPDAFCGGECLVNESLVSFCADMPLYFDAKAPELAFGNTAAIQPSTALQETLYRSLKKKLSGLTPYESVSYLLQVIQKRMPYKKDEDYWGVEKYLCPEESVYYDYTDCEDRAILFTRLVRDIVRLDAVLIYYPGHLAAAVYLPGDLPGSAVMVDGKRYLICDPSYLGAGVGVEMPDMAGKGMIIRI